MTFYEENHQRLNESLPPEESQSKTIESVILDADASEVLRLFHDKVRPYSSYQYFKKHKKDGDEKEFIHTFFKIETQNNRRLEVLEVIYPEKYEGKPRNPIHRKALIIQVWQIGKRVKIVAEFYPFFDKLVVDELSNFDQLSVMENKKSLSNKHNNIIPKTKDTWLRWRDAYAFIKSHAMGLRDNDILAKLESQKADLAVNNLKTLRDVKRAGEAGYLDEWEKFCEMTGRSAL